MFLFIDIRGRKAPKPCTLYVFHLYHHQLHYKTRQSVKLSTMGFEIALLSLVFFHLDNVSLELRRVIVMAILAFGLRLVSSIRESVFPHCPSNASTRRESTS